jgi:hypothetical protein
MDDAARGEIGVGERLEDDLDAWIEPPSDDFTSRQPRPGVRRL